MSNTGQITGNGLIAETANLPEDPKDKIYLTICFVCKDMAKPGQEHLRNYGGIVCYSCRAFWRRSHQNSRNPSFVCKKDEQCSITVATRRRCQKCRYDRCILAGMNPGAVLDDGQKKIRFRKLLLKRQRLLAKQMKKRAQDAARGILVITPEPILEMPEDDGGDDSDIGIDSDGGSNSEEAHQQVFIAPPKPYCSDKILVVKSSPQHIESHLNQNMGRPLQFQPSYGFQFQPFEAHRPVLHHPHHDIDHSLVVPPLEPLCNPLYSYQKHIENILIMQNESLRQRFLPPPPDYHQVEEMRVPIPSSPPPLIPMTEKDNIEFKIDMIIDTFKAVMNHERCQKTERLLSELNSINQGETGISVSKRDIQFLMIKMSQGFKAFALCQRDFTNLETRDQRKLLCRNTPLFIQLYMGYHLLYQSRHLPKDSKMGEKPVKKLWMNSFLQNLYLERFNSITTLFSPGADLDHYGRLITKLKGLPELETCKQLAVLSYIILFDHDENMNLSFSIEMGKLYDTCIKTCDECIPLPTLTNILLSMANFCAYNIDWNDDSYDVDDMKPQNLSYSNSNYYHC